MDRYDASRSGATPHGLADELHLHWVRQLPEPRRAWRQQSDDFDKLAFDASYEPIVVGDLMYVPCMVTDSLKAYSVQTGEKRWRYATDGPVRMAPLAWEGRIFVASDDGHLHCVDAETGERMWKFRAGPSDLNVLGNERLISMWAVRGGPVVADGTLYFAAGLWPHEGVFVYALDPETAEVQWMNSGSASGLMVDAKRYYSFGGVVPQGQLVVAGDRLLVAGGRTTPAAYDRETGELLYYQVASHSTGRNAGGHRVFAAGDWFFNVRDDRQTQMYTLLDGAQYDAVHVDLVAPEAWLGVDARNGRIHAHASEPKPTGREEPEPRVSLDRRGQPIPESRREADRRAPNVPERMSRRALRDAWDLERLWTQEVPGLRRLDLKAGSTLYGSGDDGEIFALTLDDPAEPAELIWSERVEGDVFTMLAARDRLFVVTREGRIYCFGPEQRDSIVHEHRTQPLESEDDLWTERAAQLLTDVDATGGYGLMFGIGSGRLLEELLQQSELHIVAFDTDAEKVAAIRQRLTQAGLYGSRVAVHEGDPAAREFPPYIASLIVSEDPQSAGTEDATAFVEAIYHTLRPYGGTAYLALENDAQDAFADAVEAADLENPRLTRHEDHLLLSRPGTLPGAASWTHQYADAGNTVYSPDDRVKAPLGVTWFGGPTNEKLPWRHASFPIPQVVRGRAIVLGEQHISARCVYTGREMWDYELEDFSYLQPPYLYDPGANFIGSPYASTTDSVYLVYQDRCVRLDIETGQELASFTLPDREDLRQHVTDPVMAEIEASFAAQLEERGVPGEVNDEAIDRAIATYPAAYSLADAEAISEIEPGEYYIGIVGRTGHRHRNNREIRRYSLAVDGETVDLNSRTPERGLFFEHTTAESGHAAGGFEIGTVTTTSPVELTADSELDVSRWSSSQYDRILLFRSADDLAKIPDAIRAFRQDEPARYTGDPVRWGNIRISGDYLLVAAYPHMFDDLRPGQALNWNATSSEFIVAMDRVSGEVQWVHQARYGFRHNAIAASSEKVFVIDNLSGDVVQTMQRRGIAPEIEPEIRALDVESGDVLWSYDEQVFGTWLAYSEAHDVLLQAGRRGGFGSLADEPHDRMLVLRGSDGEELWEDSSRQRRGPVGLHETRGQIIASIGEAALDMRTGERQLRQHPVTGYSEEWRWIGGLRCGSQNFSEHLITFRSGAGGFSDLAHDGGTGNIPGFRPGCTNNLVVADGMLTALDYSRGCSCSYQHQTSLGLAHRPDAEMWTYNPLSDPPENSVRRIGVNFGAPSSRLAERDDVLWVEHPLVGGPTPYVSMSVETEGDPNWIRQHASVIEDEADGHAWVAASAIERVRTVRIAGLLTGEGDDLPPVYRVRLHFAELEPIDPGERVFDVAVQGERAAGDFDIFETAGGLNRGTVIEVEAVADADGAMEITLAPADASDRDTLLSGIEIRVVE